MAFCSEYWPWITDGFSVTLEMNWNSFTIFTLGKIVQYSWLSGEVWPTRSTVQEIIQIEGILSPRVVLLERGTLDISSVGILGIGNDRIRLMVIVWLFPDTSCWKWLEGKAFNICSYCIGTIGIVISSEWCPILIWSSELSSQKWPNAFVITFNNPESGSSSPCNVVVSDFFQFKEFIWISGTLVTFPRGLHYC